MDRHDLKLGVESVSYFYGFDCGEDVGRLLQEEFADHSPILLLIDRTVERQARPLLESLAGHMRVVPLVVDVRESAKTLTTIGSLMEQAIAHGVGRRSAVVAMGGGTLGNIAGMLAALLYRGLPLIHLPTTPVAAFDAVLSAKQAVNLRQGKNLCGTFLTPSLIACDLAWLCTVPRSRFLAGAAEMAKNVLAVIPDAQDRFLAALAEYERDPESALRALLKIGIEAKAPYLALDPKEKNEALVFEYGHTVGHALEFASAGRLSHGESVAWGMLAAADVARRVCGLSEADRARHHALVGALGLDRRSLASLDPEKVKALLVTDNKRGYLNADGESTAMVLLESLGQPVFTAHRPLTAVPLALVEEAVDSLLEGAR